MSEKIEDQNNQSKVSTWLRDPIWQFVGALLAAVGIFIAIFLPLISGQKREISVKTSFSTILSAKEDLIDPDIKIIYKGNEVKKVLVSEITFLILEIQLYYPMNTSNQLRLN